VDEQEIRAFLKDTYPRLVGVVSLLTGSVPAAEDAVQEALARAWERSRRGEEIERLDGWVATTALNLSRSALRRLIVERRAQIRLISDAATPEPDVDRVDLQRSLRRLPRRQRQVLLLRAFLGLSLAEIADVMGTTEGTVKSQLAKARRQLISTLSVDPDPESNMEMNHAKP
jgi:RNA polymerase sigma factor (sigma-70 family)